MKRIVLTSTLLFLMLSLTLCSIDRSAGQTTPEYGTYGPKVNYLQLIVYNGYDAEAAAFQAGSIDVMDWPLDYETYMVIKDDPNYVKEPLTMYDIYDIDINCLRWPTSDYHFRQALGYLIDYEGFYTDILRAYSGVLMDNIIWSEWTKWYNSEAMLYQFDPATALDILANAGYQDWDSDGTLEFNNGTTYELPPLEFYSRSDDPIRNALGDMMNADINAIGIPTNYHVANPSICWAHAYKTPYDYHLYTAGMGPFKDVQFLYDYYHSQFADPTVDWVMNNVFFMNATYDSYVEQMKFAADEVTATQACKNAEGIFMEQLPLIPVYHSAGYEAYRANYGHWAGEEAYWDQPWHGFVNTIIPTVNSGINDYWSLLTAHPANAPLPNASVLRFGMLSNVDHMNPVTSYSTWDAIILEELFATLTMSDPFTGEQIPWLARTWNLGTWDYGGQPATKLTITLNDGLKWSDGTPLNSSDVAFTMKYMYDAASPGYYAYVEKIDGISTATPHIETPNANTVIIYYTVQSMFALEWAGDMPIMPKSVWQTVPPTQTDNQGEFVKKGNLTCSGPFLLDSYKKGEWWLLRRNPYFARLKNPGDANNDWKVNILDMVIVAIQFGRPPPPITDPRADINGDGKINILDCVIIAIHFGEQG